MQRCIWSRSAGSAPDFGFEYPGKQCANIGKISVNDNEMSDLQRLRVLEDSVGKMRDDLARVERMLRLTPTKPRLKKQKGAIERLIFLAQVEIGKLRKGAK